MVETNTYIIISIVVAILAVALGAAYTTGNLNPLFEWVGVYYFKAKAKAEEKKMEAEGQKEGEDFLKSEFFTFRAMIFLGVEALDYIGSPMKCWKVDMSLLEIFAFLTLANIISIGELKGNQQAGELQQNLEDISNIKKGLL
jgi:hypothetical protein